MQLKSEAYNRAIRWAASKILSAQEPFDWQPDIDLIAHAFQAELVESPLDDDLARDFVGADVSRVAGQMVMNYVDEFPDEVHWYLPRYKAGSQHEEGMW